MVANSSLPCDVDVLLGFRMIYLTIPFAVIISGKSLLIVLTAYRRNAIEIYVKFLVISLAATDLILAVAYLCIGDSEHLVANLGISQSNYFESFLLGAWHSSVVVHLAHLATTAVESYIRIAHPFVYMRANTKLSACIVVLFLWTFLLSYMFVPLLVFTKESYHKKCILLHPPLEYYCVGVFVYLVSCVTVLVTNLKISFLAFRNKKAAIARRLGTSKIALREHFLAAARSIKFVSVMCGTYLFCSFPSAVCIGLNIFYPVPGFIYLPSLCLVPIHSLLSVIIWFFVNRHFSEAVKRIFSNAKKLLL